MAYRTGRRGALLVVVEAEVGDEVLTHKCPEGVLELYLLDEEVVLWVELGQGHRALEVEGEPLLDTAHPGPVREVHKEGEVQDYRGGEDRVAGKEVYLDLHRVAQPPEDVNVVPALLGIAARGVVVDLDDVRDVSVELGVLLGVEDALKDRELTDLLALEALLVVEDLPVAVAQDVRRVPPCEAQHSGLQAWRHHRLHQGLTSLEVLAGDRYFLLVGQLHKGRHIGGERWSAVGVGDTLLDGGVGVDHRRGDGGIRPIQGLLEGLQAKVRLLRLGVGLRRGAVDHHRPLQAVFFLEGAYVLPDLLGGLSQGAIALGVGGGQLGYPALIKDRREGLYFLELLSYSIQVLFLQDSSEDRRVVGTVREGVPAAEDEVVHLREGYELFHLRHPVLGALSETYGAELGERADRLCVALLYQFHPGNEGCRHRPHPRHQHA